MFPCQPRRHSIEPSERVLTDLSSASCNAQACHISLLHSLCPAHSSLLTSGCEHACCTSMNNTGQPWPKLARLCTLRPAGARQQPRAHDALDDAPVDDIEGALRIARVVAQEHLVVRVVPAVAALRQPRVHRVADLEAAHILCAPQPESNMSCHGLPCSLHARVSKPRRLRCGKHDTKHPPAAVQAVKLPALPESGCLVSTAAGAQCRPCFYKSRQVQCTMDWTC